MGIMKKRIHLISYCQYGKNKFTFVKGLVDTLNSSLRNPYGNKRLSITHVHENNSILKIRMSPEKQRIVYFASIKTPSFLFSRSYVFFGLNQELKALY